MSRSILAVALTLFSLPVLAASTSVIPTAIISNEASRVEMITIQNQGSGEVSFEVSVHTLGADGTMTPSKDFIISPSIVKIPGQDKRVVRLGRSKPGQAFYKVVARQLPPPFEGKSGVQLITTHIIPAAFQPKGEPALAASVSGGKLVLTNSGSAVARVSAIGPAGGKPALEGALGWVLPGTSRTFDYAPQGQVDVRLMSKAETLPVN